jgi:hypothetical protein
MSVSARMTESRKAMAMTITESSMLARRHVFERLVMLALALCTQPAWAFLDAPYITPMHPNVSDLISVNIYGGGCDFADGGVVWPPPVTQQGSELTILLTGGHEEDPEFCYFGVGTFTAPIGMYPPGSYTLRVNWRYSTFGGWVTETLGIIPFIVANAQSQQPAEAPALGMTGLGALVLALIAATMPQLRERLA